MLQVHDFIQNLPYDAKFSFVKKMLTEFSERENGACFDFGDTDKLENEVCENITRYACELAKHKLFNLPYNPVYYSWSIENKIFGAYILQEENPDDYAGFKVVFMFGERKPFKYAGIGTLEINDLGKAAVTETKVPIDLRGTISHLAYGVVFPDDSEERMFESVCYYTVMLTALMESPHTKTKITSVGKKLNLKRAKRGVPQIMPFHTVYFEVDGKEYNSDGTERGGTHASPKMHWRRGHIRHLGNNKITHVRPCLVGAIGTEPHVAKPAYSMKQKGHAA